MRVIISAIALVLAIGAGMPLEADARAPRKIEMWGCTFKAVGVGTWASSLPPGPWDWGGLGRITCPGERQQLVISMSAFEDVPGGPNRLVGQGKDIEWFGGRRSDMLWQTDIGTCIPDGAPPVHPYYLRMKVQRKGQPGAVWLASPNEARPCGPYAGPSD